MISAPERDPEQHQPIFVLSTARSYSSVVASMIGQHPDLAGVPELKLFAYSSIRALEDSLPNYWRKRGATHRSPGLVRAIAEFKFGDQSIESIANSRKWLADRGCWAGCDVFDFLARRAEPRSLVEKSPENAATDDALGRIVASYPRARFLHLTRHPVTTQQSMADHWQRTVPDLPAPEQPLHGLCTWLDVHCRIVRFGKSIASERQMRVRAEDVLNHPHSQLVAICRWLNIRSDDEAIVSMMHPENSPFAMFGPDGSGVVGGYDHAFLKDPVPRQVPVPKGISKANGWVGDAMLWREIESVASMLGYS